jgi:DNA-binding transcriptional MerR regulator
MSPDPSPLSIGALARQADCNVPTIRYYEEIGLLPKPRRGTGGQRVYQAADLKRLTFIRRCRDFQFPIEQIRDLVRLIENPAQDCTAAKDVAEAQLSIVRKKLDELGALEKSLSQVAERCAALCAGGPIRDCVIVEDLAAPNCCG